MPCIVERKQTKLEAVQWNGSNTQEVRQFIKGNTVFYKTGEPANIDSAVGILMPKEWWVVNEHGRLTCYDSETFCRLFQTIKHD